MHIQPIEDDPRYHVVYWVDEGKVPRSPHGGADYDKKKALNEFSDALQKEKAAAKNP
jgi:hypothetical protein